MTGRRGHPIKSEQNYRSSESYPGPLSIISSLQDNVSVSNARDTSSLDQRAANQSYHRISVLHIARANLPMFKFCLLSDWISGPLLFVIIGIVGNGSAQNSWWKFNLGVQFFCTYLPRLASQLYYFAPVLHPHPLQPPSLASRGPN